MRQIAVKTLKVCDCRNSRELPMSDRIIYRIS